MATLSASREPAVVASRPHFPVDRARSAISRSTSPAPKNGDTATIVAFRNARDTYRKSLSEKDMRRIMIPTGPEDVVKEIENWRKNHSSSKIAAGVRAGLVRLQRFSASIDMLAQGTPSPGCLLWGSIKFVLTVSSMLFLYMRCSLSLHEGRHLPTEAALPSASQVLALSGNIYRS